MDVFKEKGSEILSIRELYELAKSIPMGINEDTIDRFNKSKILLEDSINGRNLKGEVKIQNVLGPSYAIMITGDYISIVNPRSFHQAIRLASNFEVYPRTDGKAQMNFSFSNRVKGL